MKTADVGINTVTYGCMLDACVKCGNYEKAEDVFAEMKGAGPARTQRTRCGASQGWDWRKWLFRRR